jgi:hypothetical protein
MISDGVSPCPLTQPAQEPGVAPGLLFGEVLWDEFGRLRRLKRL